MTYYCQLNVIFFSNFFFCLENSTKQNKKTLWQQKPAKDYLFYTPKK